MRIFWLLAVLQLFAPLINAQEEATMLHFKPRDHALGDVHPFFHQGECFLYYLKPGKYESVLARSKDWLRWTETPLTHDEVKPADWMSPYFVLGVFHDPVARVFRSFYGHAQGRMVSSVSDDLLHWACAPKEFHVPASGYYQRRRDPFIFWIPEMKQYGCVMTTWMKGRPKETCGAVSLATSPDLMHWKDHGPILDPGTIGEPECPQMFQLGGAGICSQASMPVRWASLCIGAAPLRLGRGKTSPTACWTAKTSVQPKSPSMVRRPFCLAGYRSHPRNQANNPGAGILPCLVKYMPCQMAGSARACLRNC